jgi:hypothetical protein
VQGQRVGAGPSAIRAERVRARARTEGVRVRARAVRRCGEGRRLWAGGAPGRWSAGEKNRKGKLSVWLRGGSSGLCSKSRLASANRELAARAHHEHTLAVFFTSAPLITLVYVCCLNHPYGTRPLLTPCTLFITPVSVSCFIPHVSAIYHPYPLSRRYTCIPHWCSCPL